MVRAVLHKEIITGVTCIAAGILKDPSVVNWKDVSGLIPWYRNNVVMSPRTSTPVRTDTEPSVLPISIWSQNIEGPRRSIVPQEVRNAKKLDASINIIPSKHRDLTLSWRKIISSK